MLRSVQPLARRSLSVAAQGAPPAAAPTPAATPPPPLPPPPPSPPARRSSLMLRVIPLATVSAAGYVAYRASNDNEFRTTVTTTFPQAAPVIDLLPTPSPSSASSSPSPLTSVQLRIEDKTSNSVPIASSASTPAEDKPATPSPKSQSTSASPPPPPPTESKPDHAPAPVSKPAKPAAVPDPTPAPAHPAAPHPSQHASTMPADDTSDPTHRSMSGKEKLARLIGKGDFSADDVRGKDVVSDSEFRRPSAWTDSAPPALPPPPSPPTRSSSTAVTRVSPGRTPAPVPSPPSMPPPAPTTPSQTVMAIAPASSPPATVTAAPGADETDALRAELAGQARWEAVRLQEAVAAQRVASTKEAAREAGEIARRHAAEIVEVRETASKQLEAAVEERGRAVERRMLAEREAAVETAVARREGEVRDVARAEAATAAAEAARGRESTVMALSARVDALDARFGRVVDAGLALREAGQRAAAAFVLRDAVAEGGGEPLGSALKAACGAGEVGRLAAAAVPDTAVKAGVSSVRGLEHDFGAASRRGLAAAAVPEQHAGSLWAHALGAVFSRLKLPVDVRLDEDGNPRNDEERIRLAKQLMREGELSDAVRTLDGLSGLSKEVMSEWVGKAKARLAAKMAADVLTAEAIVSQVGVAAAAQKS